MKTPAGEQFGRRIQLLTMNIIPKTQGDFNAIPPLTNNLALPIGSVRFEAFVESADMFSVSNGGVKTAKELKVQISFRKLLIADGHKVRKSGKRFSCRCPFHDEDTPSFFLSENDQYGHCFGCGWKGDIFAYVMQRDSVDFSSALKQLKELALLSPTKCTAVEHGPSTMCPTLSMEQAKVMESAPERIIGEEWLQHRIADPRKWNPATIVMLAQQGYLGWVDGTLAFIYPQGIKIRNWPSKYFRWLFGSQFLWRADRIKDASCIYLTEGETDAISLIDIGMECAGAAVVCVPGASAFKEEWAPLFTGKQVILCFDNDDAGKRATRLVAQMLQPYARKISTINLGGIK